MGACLKFPFKGMFIIGLAVAAPALSWADPAGEPAAAASTSAEIPPPNSGAGPATRPSHLNNNVDGGAGAGGGGGGIFGDGRQRPGFGGRRPDGLGQDDITAAIDFYTKNSPNRMEYFNKLPADGPMRRAETMRLVQLYRPLENFKDSSPELYKKLVQQVNLRDQAFALARDNKDKELAAKVAEIVPVSLEARSMRLDLLQKELADQQSNLADDEAHKDLVTQRELNNIKEDEVRLVRRAERRQGQLNRQSMLDFDTSMDPLAEAAPIFTDRVLPTPPTTADDDAAGARNGS
jgi:hypothetical protein